MTARESLEAAEWAELRTVPELRKEQLLPVLRELFARGCRDLVRRAPGLPPDAEAVLDTAARKIRPGAYWTDFGLRATSLLEQARRCRHTEGDGAADPVSGYLCDVGGWERTEQLTALLARPGGGTSAQLIVQRRPCVGEPELLQDPVGTMFVGLGPAFVHAVATAWEHVRLTHTDLRHDVRWWVRPDPGDHDIDGESAGAAFAALFAVCLDPQRWRTIAPGWAVVGRLEPGPEGRIATVRGVPKKLSAAGNLRVVVPDRQIGECRGQRDVVGAGTVAQVVQNVVRLGPLGGWPDRPGEITEIVAAGVERVRALLTGASPVRHVVVAGPRHAVRAVCALAGDDGPIRAAFAGGLHWVGAERPAATVVRHQLGLSPDRGDTAIPPVDGDGGPRLAVLVDVPTRSPERAEELPGWALLVAGPRSRYGPEGGWSVVDLDDTLRAEQDQLAERIAATGELDRIVWPDGVAIGPDELRRWWPEGHRTMDRLVGLGLAQLGPDGYAIGRSLVRVLDGRPDRRRRVTEFLKDFGHEPQVRRNIGGFAADLEQILPTMRSYERLVERIREDGWQAAIDDLVALPPHTDKHLAAVVDALWAARGAGDDGIAELPGALLGRCPAAQNGPVVTGLRAGALAHHERPGTVTVVPLDASLGGRDDALVRVHDLHSPVDAVAVSPSGQRVAAATRSGRVLVWERDSCTPDRADRACRLTDRIEALTCSDDGVVVICTSEPAVLRWDPDREGPERLDAPAPARPARPVWLGGTVLLACAEHGLAVVGRHLVELVGPFDGAVTAVASAGSDRILIGTATGTLGLHSGRPDVTPIRSWRLPAGVAALHAQRSGTRAVAALSDGSVVVVDLAEAEAYSTITGCARPESLLITDIGRVVVGSAAGLTVHDLDSGGCEVGAHLDHVRDMALLAGGREVVAALAAGRLHRAGLDGRHARSFAAHRGRFSVQPAGPGPLLLTGGYDRTVRMWDLGRAGRAQAHRATVTHLVTGAGQAVSAAGDGSVVRWSLEAGSHSVIAQGIEVTHAGATGDAAFFTDADGGIWHCGWNGSAAVRFATVLEISAFATAGAGVVVGTVGGRIEILGPGGHPRRVLWEGPDAVRALCAGGPGMLAAGTDGGAVVLRLADAPGDAVATVPAGHVGAVTVTPSGAVVLGTATGVTVLVPDTDGFRRETFPTRAPVHLLLDHDGDRTAVLAAAVNGWMLGLLQGWDLFEHTDLPVAAVAATRLRAGGVTDAAVLAEDGTVTFWDLDRWREVRRFTGNRSITAIADGGTGPAGTQVLVAGDVSGAVHRLEVRP